MTCSFAEVVSVGEVAALHLERGQFGALVLQDVGQDGDRLTGQLAWLLLLRLGQSGAFPFDALVTLQFGRWPGTGLRVGDPGRARWSHRPSCRPGPRDIAT